MKVKMTTGGLTMAERTREKIAADWASRGFSCDLWTDPPGQRWDDFRHATDELVVVLQGQVEFEVAGKVHHLQVDEELVIPAGAVHSVRNVGTTTARWLYGYRRPQELCDRSCQADQDSCCVRVTHQVLAPNCFH
jgi:mannose-6-phosphate isomerase-like protein (cupin superfamily)